MLRQLSLEKNGPFPATCATSRMFIGRERVFDAATHVLHPLHLAFASCPTEAQDRAPPPQPVQHRRGLGAPAPPPQPVQHRPGLGAPAPPPQPVQHRPGLGGRSLGACIQLSRNPWTQVLPLAPGGDDHSYIVYILNKYVSIRMQELYFALFQAVNRQEGLTILQPALPDQDFGCSSWERHLNLFCENSRDVALCYVPTIPGYRRLTICRRSNLFQKKCTGAKKHRMWEQPFRGPGRAALPPVQK